MSDRRDLFFSPIRFNLDESTNSDGSFEYRTRFTINGSVLSFRQALALQLLADYGEDKSLKLIISSHLISIGEKFVFTLDSNNVLLICRKEVNNVQEYAQKEPEKFLKNIFRHYRIDPSVGEDLRRYAPEKLQVNLVERIQNETILHDIELPKNITELAMFFVNEVNLLITQLVASTDAQTSAFSAKFVYDSKGRQGFQKTKFPRF